jgi:hypothetical protein
MDGLNAENAGAIFGMSMDGLNADSWMFPTSTNTSRISVGRNAGAISGTSTDGFEQSFGMSVDKLA